MRLPANRKKGRVLVPVDRKYTELFRGFQHGRYFNPKPKDSCGVSSYTVCYSCRRSFLLSTRLLSLRPFVRNLVGTDFLARFFFFSRFVLFISTLIHCGLEIKTTRFDLHSDVHRQQTRRNRLFKRPRLFAWPVNIFTFTTVERIGRVGHLFD